MNNIAIFASGSGTNAENIIHFFRTHPNIKVTLVLSNKVDAKVLERAKNNDIQSLTFTREDFYNSDIVLSELQRQQISHIVLAGFLWLIPQYLINAYRDKIINIHPALLPKYGGKGMYGDRVHQAVIANKESESGISIHHVNERYDEGNIIFQAKCSINPEDTPESLASKIHELEYKYFPGVIEDFVLK